MTPYIDDIHTSPIVVDIETCGLEDAANFLEPIPDAVPDDSPIEADKRLTDPVKIAADLERKRIARVQQNLDAQTKVEQQRKARLERTALDFNLGRVVALAWWTEQDGTRVYLGKDAHSEASALMLFWRECRHRTIVGFRVREFDLPMLIQRSRYLHITHPVLDLGRYARGSGISDLYDVLTFQDMRAETVMKRSLKSFARRFGLPVEDAIDGAEIPALVAAGQWDQVVSHVTSDLELTVALARRLQVVPSVETESVA